MSSTSASTSPPEWSAAQQIDQHRRIEQQSPATGPSTPTSIELGHEPIVDLKATWQSVVSTIEELRTSFRARVLTPAIAVPGLRGQFGIGVTVTGEPDTDGRVEVEIGANSAEAIAQQLAGWGRYLEVISPDEVRHELARIGRELVDLHGAT